jgi:hypothetical protein
MNKDMVLASEIPKEAPSGETNRSSDLIDSRPLESLCKEEIYSGNR